jgi:hypothetical protein
MRYLLHAYQQKHSSIKALVRTKDYQEFLRQAAQTACTVDQVDLFDSLNVLANLDDRDPPPAMIAGHLSMFGCGG